MSTSIRDVLDAYPPALTFASHSSLWIWIQGRPKDARRYAWLNTIGRARFERLTHGASFKRVMVYGDMSREKAVMVKIHGIGLAYDRGSDKRGAILAGLPFFLGKMRALGKRYKSRDRDQSAYLHAAGFASESELDQPMDLSSLEE